MPRRIRHDLDLAWKEALTAYLPQFLELFLPEVHRDIDWGRPVEFLDGEVRRLNRGLSGQRRHADLVVRVHLLSGTLAMVVIHVEVQSQKDNQMPLRMRLYSDRLFERHRCPIYSLLVLGDADPQWRPSLYESRIWGCRSSLEFPTLKLLDWQPRRAELEDSGNPLALVVAAHLAVLETNPEQPARVQRALRLCRLMHTHGFAGDDTSRLFEVLEAMMAMTDDRYGEFEAGVALLEEELGVTLITRSQLKGMKKGLEQGREQGLEQGRRRSILEIAEARFGTIPEGLEGVLETISDHGALKRLVRMAATVARVEEVLEAALRESRG